MIDHDCKSTERADSWAEDLDGELASADQIAENFALYGSEKRAAALQKMSLKLRGEIDSGSHNLRRHAQLVALRRKMGGVHEALRKAKR